jgi:hypothetical protein
MAERLASMSAHPASNGEQAAQAVLRGDPAHPVMCVSDGRGGVLLLDTRDPELRWLAHGIRLLLGDGLPGAGGAIKVSAGQATYWLSRVEIGHSEVEFRIASLYDPSQTVQLPDNVIALLADLIEQHSLHLTA